MKKIISLLLAMVLTLSSITAFGLTAYAETNGDADALGLSDPQSPA